MIGNILALLMFMNLDALIENRGVRILGLMLATLVALVSIGFLVASKNISSRSHPDIAVLPEQPYNLPIVRLMPKASLRQIVAVEVPVEAKVAKSKVKMANR